MILVALVNKLVLRYQQLILYHIVHIVFTYMLFILLLYVLFVVGH